ncbi:hypothetical protein [Marinobacter sp. MIT932201]|uniref:hypothetical protein n=1 Tax=Marinobacter sp. MIT932201 TaxID=3096995 RepID=UPI00399A8280
MSTEFKSTRAVPLEKIITRLKGLSEAITKGGDYQDREFTMRIPAECDRDADLVIAEAATRLQQLQAANRDLQAWFDDARAEAEKAQERIKDLEQVATSVRRDLILRAEPDWDGSGQQVVNLSAGIWDELNRVLDIKGNRREGK